MSEQSVPAMRASSPERDNPFTRSLAGIIGMVTLTALVLVCVGSLPWTLGESSTGALRYNQQNLDAILLPPSWAPHDEAEAARRDALEGDPFFLFGTDMFGRDVFIRCLTGGGISIGIGIAAALIAVGIGTLYGAIAGYVGGRVDSVMMRIVDILYGLPYILLVVLLAVAGDALIDEWALKKNARTDAINSFAIGELERRGVESPTKDDARALLDAEPEFRASVDQQLSMGVYLDEDGYDRWLDERAPGYLVLTGEARTVQAARDMVSADDLRDDFRRLRSLHPHPLTEGQRKTLEVIVLLIAIGGVSWLTMARVIRGQVLSLKERPFMEAARAMGVPVHTQFARHLLPNLIGPIVVYATLTVPQAILQESFLSFLGIGVQAPLPSWGNLAAEGLSELNTVKVRWWLIVTPCVLLGVTLLALNFVGEGLREAFDPKRARK
ncbi:MAG: hypothetical protein Tsb0013_15480 [Phycisphaerales bacterium]